MRKIILSVLLTGILLAFTGCGTARSEGIKPASETPAESEIPANPPAPNQEAVSAVTNIGQRLGDAVKDAYSGLEIDAFVRPRNAILPGFAIPVTVTVKNTGGESVDYIRGSGSFTTPEALFIEVDGLQTVVPEDHLGIMTMDFRTEELNPGDTLEYIMYVMAIEPNDKFDTYTNDMHNASGEYIAEKAWPELQTEFPDLIPAKAGSYKGHAYFLYYTRNESGVANFTEMPDGYAEYEFKLGVG